jgi:hypothetical protein
VKRFQLFGALAAAAALLLAAVPASLAAEPQRPLDTTPTINHDNPTGYYLWRTNDGGTFHLRTHGPDKQHDFDAVLRTDGTFENVDPVRLDQANGDHVDLRDGGHELAIHFHTYDFTDGVNFTVRDGGHVHFNLKLDGQDIATDSIFIGANGRHPQNNPFSIKL